LLGQSTRHSGTATRSELRAPVPHPKETTMHRIHRIHRIRGIHHVLASLAGLGCALMAFAGTASVAFATEVPPPGGPAGIGPAPAVSVPTVVTGGMPGWQIALIALGAALLAATIAVFLDRTRAGRRIPSAASA
jgi:hypothetical protein